MGAGREEPGNFFLNLCPQNWGRYISYDALDRLVQAKRGGVEVNFTYDPFGRRPSKHVHDDSAWIWKDAEECYFYDGDIELGAQDHSNRITQARVLGWSPQRDIGSAIGVEIGGKAYAPIHDLQGNIRILVDPRSGLSSATYEYTSFGEGLSSEFTIENPWRYASKRWDKETGLILFGKRYYDPMVGKWLTRDPAGFSQSTNPYQFCFNSPWCYNDPDGDFVFLLAIPIIYAGSWATAPIIADVAIGAAVLTGTGWACHQMDKSFNGRPTTDYGGQATFVGGTLLYQSSRSGLFNNDLSSWFRDNPDSSGDKRHTSDQEAINEIVKETGKGRISNSDADALLDWCEEYQFPSRDDRGKDHWVGGEHIHVGGKHVPVKGG